MTFLSQLQLSRFYFREDFDQHAFLFLCDSYTRKVKRFFEVSHCSFPYTPHPSSRLMIDILSDLAGVFANATSPGEERKDTFISSGTDTLRP